METHTSLKLFTLSYDRLNAIKRAANKATCLILIIFSDSCTAEFWEGCTGATGWVQQTPLSTMPGTLKGDPSKTASLTISTMDKLTSVQVRFNIVFYVAIANTFNISE